MKSLEYKDYDELLQNKYPVLKRPKFDNKYHDFDKNYTIYQNYGFEGITTYWFRELIEPMMQEIYDCYASFDKEPDLLIEQIKEKWGGLRFYYSIDKDHRQAIHGFDGIGGSGVRLKDNSSDLAKNIAKIVSKYEFKSKEICIYCGERGEIRNTIYVLCLCDKCLQKRKEQSEKNKGTLESYLKDN